MARPRKVGLDYFSHDVDLSSDDKVEAMEAKFGPIGYAFYLKSLERIYRHAAPIEYPGVFRSIISGKLRISEEELDGMIEFACKIRLLYQTKDGGIMSEGAAKRISYIEKERETDRNRVSGNNPDSSPTENPRIRGERKGKERKVKEIKKERPPTPIGGLLDLQVVDGLKAKFEEARKQYPGTKNGLEREWGNFEKKLRKIRNTPREVVPKILPAIQAEKADKEGKAEAGAFCPAWKNFQTWINGECWDQELGETGPASGRPGPPPSRFGSPVGFPDDIIITGTGGNS